jgi:DNA-binding XRE family transcriptional regulator
VVGQAEAGAVAPPVVPEPNEAPDMRGDTADLAAATLGCGRVRGCARLLSGHQDSLSCWSRPFGCLLGRRTRGAVFISAYTIPQIFTIVYRYGKIFTVNYGTMEVDVDTIKELRINAGLSQRELATRAGLTPGAVWQVEHRGSGSPATLKKLADVLGVRPVDLLKERR